MPKVSIIIPSYNHAAFIIDRLESIANQIYTNWEAIIIDDNSTDDSVKIINEFLNQNRNFNVKHFIVNDENSGSGYKSWKKGIELAATEFIWIAETDDYSDSYFLEEMVRVLENNLQTVLAFCSSNYVDRNKKYLYDSSKRISRLKADKDEYKIFDDEILLDSMPLSPLITNGSSVVFRKPSSVIPEEIFQQKQLSDLFLWTYLAKNKNFGFLNKNLNFFRRHEDSTTTKNQLTNQERLFDEMIFYSNYFKLSKEKVKAIISHFVENFLFSKNLGYIFSKNPLNKIESLNKIEIRWYYTKSICQIFIKKLIKSLCRAFQS